MINPWTEELPKLITVAALRIFLSVSEMAENNAQKIQQDVSV
jgi:hypothetical protein